MSESKPLALMLQAGDHRHLHAFVSLVATAAASGRRVHVFLTHEALHSFLTDVMDESPTGYSTDYSAIYDRARDDGRIPELEDLLFKARRTGKVRLYGCSASIALRQGYSEEELSRLDGIVGHTTFLRWALAWQLVYI